MTGRTRGLAGPLCGALLPLLLLAGCGGGTGSAEKPSSTPTPSASESSASTPPPTQSASTPPGTPVRTGKASIIIPPGWDVLGPGQFADAGGNIICAMVQTGGFPERSGTRALVDQLGKEALHDFPNTHREPDLVVNGVRLFHVAAKDHDVTYNDEFGAFTDHAEITIQCRSGIGMIRHSKAVREINRVMSTFRFR